MTAKTLKARWTIINIEDEVQQSIVEFAKQNGYTVARAIKELTRRDLRRWKKRNQKQ